MRKLNMYLHEIHALHIIKNANIIIIKYVKILVISRNQTRVALLLDRSFVFEAHFLVSFKLSGLCIFTYW